MKTIQPRELHERIRAGESIDLVDVRTPVEYREVHVTVARNIPLDRLDPSEVAQAHGDGKPLYVICRSGNRARQACEKLEQVGLQVVNVEGGTQAWEQAGLPVRRGKKAISLERQVRIAAGLLVFAGSVLAAAVHPYWAGLPAFVGAGLVFAGITETCGMGMLLARRPWHQVGATPASTATPKASETSAPEEHQACCG